MTSSPLKVPFFVLIVVLKLSKSFMHFAINAKLVYNLNDILVDLPEQL